MAEQHGTGQSQSTQSNSDLPVKETKVSTKPTYFVLQVSELGTAKSLSQRIAALRVWHSGGGVMIMGYDSYRILSLAKRVGSDVLKEELKSLLVDPGTI